MSTYHGRESFSLVSVRYGSMWLSCKPTKTRVLSFVFLSPSRLSLCVYWALAVAVTIVVWVLVLDFVNPNAQQQSSMFSSEVENKVLTSALNKKRKLFHGLAVAMFIPGVLFEVFICPYFARHLY